MELPLPIPNRVVKHSSADNSNSARNREDRSSPGFLDKKRRTISASLVLPDIVALTLAIGRRRIFLTNCIIEIKLRLH